MIRCEDYLEKPYRCASCSEYINCHIADAYEAGVETGMNMAIDKCIDIVRDSYFQMEAEDRIAALKENK